VPIRANCVPLVSVVALQRVYGITFPDKDLMKDYLHRMEEAKKRDHRTLGVQQELIMFDRLSPGSAFFLPNGTRVFNALVEVTPRAEGAGVCGQFS
jgi:threonyl-tRNA synthetase